MIVLRSDMRVGKKIAPPQNLARAKPRTALSPMLGEMSRQQPAPGVKGAHAPGLLWPVVGGVLQVLRRQHPVLCTAPQRRIPGVVFIDGKLLAHALLHALSYVHHARPYHTS